MTIWYQPYPQTNLIQRATVLTGSGGTFSFVVTPQILTTYEAQWKTAYATPQTVEVAPRLTLARDGAWIVHVSGGRSFAGAAVQFQRLNMLTGQWVTLEKVVLNDHSSARFSSTLPKGVNHLRLALSVNQAGAGYLGVVGTPIRFRQSS